eukprot:Protomagalhaensia_sp_Gyna_25__651@NODE_1303_length_1960_cov_134_368037_g1039_i0_p1_GENE_NODE_1303_length_1960_cov_134_368037_g1039_i0NODE_1303_length_1960_cov_134_368037_g1039_i0_p1_ORF_typecomplete_len547_score117_13PWI/PF01480_17/6_3e10RRM_1/PF00076_22/5e09RRM_1/PF00076_22/1_8e04_NODE_1303_length_1960_cov_134_368037_g1039_i0361676
MVSSVPAGLPPTSVNDVPSSDAIPKPSSVPGAPSPDVLRVDYPSSTSRPLNRPFGSNQDRLEAIYIGHIARDVSDELLKKVLLQCGTIAKWTRSRDPMTDAPTSFGFCEFESPEAVWRVTRLINGLTLGGQQLTVTCPAKTRELVERWHSQRLYHLQKANPSWTTELVEQEFRQDDERVKSIVDTIAADIEQAIVKNKAEREAEEAAKQVRMAAMKARLNDRRDGNRDSSLHQGRKRPRLSADNAARNQEEEKPFGVPAAIANREARRLETVKQRLADMAIEYTKRAKRWNDELSSVAADIQRKHRRFEEAINHAVPSRRVILQMIECDLRGVQYQLSLPYLDSLGRSIHYDVSGRELLESAPREQDEDGIPLSRNWQKKAMTERARMREIEKKEDAADEEDEVREAAEAKELEARQAAIKKRREKKLGPEKPAETQEEEPGAAVEEVGAAGIGVDWLELKSSGFLDKDGPLKQWLVGQMEDYVGKDDSAELAEYIMDLLPPEAKIVPTEDSLTKELAEFLEEESEQFVKALWKKMASQGKPVQDC